MMSQCKELLNLLAIYRLINVSNFDIVWFILKTLELIFLVDFEQVLYKYFLVEILCFIFCKWFITLLYKSNFIAM